MTLHLPHRPQTIAPSHIEKGQAIRIGAGRTGIVAEVHPSRHNTRWRSYWVIRFAGQQGLTIIPNGARIVLIDKENA